MNLNHRERQYKVTMPNQKARLVMETELVADNEGDDDFCGWAHGAEIGDTYETGGAQGDVIVERVK